MGIFDWLTGNRAPDPIIPAVTPGELVAALLALNADDLPWRVVDVRQATPSAFSGWLEKLSLANSPDLIAEWKFDDSRWHRQLADDNMSPGFHMLMRLDADERVVRSVDHDGSSNARADGLGFEISASRVQQLSTGFAMSFDRNADCKWVKSASATSTDDMKQPLRKSVARSGWGWKGVAFGRF